MPVAGRAAVDPAALRLAPGDAVGPEGRITERRWREGVGLELVLAPTGGGEAVRVRVTSHADGQGAYCRTPSLDVSFLAEPGTSLAAPGEAALGALCRTLAAAEGSEPATGAPGVDGRAPLALAIVLTALFALFLRWPGGCAALDRRPRLTLGLAALVVGGMAVARLAGLEAPFDLDLVTQRVMTASRPLAELASHTYADSRHPALPFVLVHAALAVDEGEAAARLPGVLASLAVAVALFFVTRRQLGGARALLATALVATAASFVPVARDLSELPLLALLALLFGDRILRAHVAVETRGRSWAAGAALALVTGALLHTSYLAPLVVVGGLLVLVVHGRDRAAAPAWWGLGLGVTLGLPALADLVAVVREDLVLRETAAALPQHLWGGEGVGALVLGLGGLLPPGLWRWPFLALLVVGVARLVAGSRRAPAALFVAAMAVLSIAATLLAAAFVRVQPYYAVWALPFVAVALVVGALGATERPRARVAHGLGALALAAALAGQALGLATELPALLATAGHDAPRALGRVLRASGPDLVVTEPASLHTLVLYYGFPEPLDLYRTCRFAPGAGVACGGPGPRLVGQTEPSGLAPGFEARAVARVASLPRPLWLVLSERFPSAPLAAWAAQNGEEVGRFGPLVLHRIGGRPRDASRAHHSPRTTHQKEQFSSGVGGYSMGAAVNGPGGTRR